MKIEAYLSFSGQCEEAFNFYAKVLGGKVDLFRYKDSPMANQVSADQQNIIMHGRLAAGDAVLMGADNPKAQAHQQAPSGFCVSLGVEDPKEAERLFSALSEGGKIQMPIQETFWSPRFGMFIDKFGIPWMVNTVAAAQHAAQS
jgi:PhnB protein